MNLIIMGPGLDLSIAYQLALMAPEPEYQLILIHPEPKLDPYLDHLMDQTPNLILVLPKPMEPESIPSLDQLVKEFREQMPPRLDLNLDLEQWMKQRQADLLMDPRPIPNFPPIRIRLHRVPIRKRIRPMIRNQLKNGTRKKIGRPEFAPRLRRNWIS
ncbi:hypothetical protein LX87_05190 [Larkinella arboricola]|uniref:Uncharacterized protein n=1 Tax=Larkinella arboricola TaxID=643671 RepID=A0A327WNW2_LARAB|nr:hypothetical protein [Larkinella arboricola]RAJ92222.1 hypothetical protein LX87_05190 [Larkinella arboricola]